MIQIIIIAILAVTFFLCLKKVIGDYKNRISGRNGSSGCPGDSCGSCSGCKGDFGQKTPEKKDV